MQPIDFYCDLTPNNQKVAISLCELELAFVLKRVRLDQGEQHEDGFAKICPNRKTPAIVDPEGPGGSPLALFESAAIVIYLADKTGRLMPQDPARRATVTAWTFWQMANLGPMAGQAWHFAPKRREQHYAAGRFCHEGRRLWQVMNERLAESRHLGDADYSVADIVTLPWVIASRRLFGLKWADHANVRRWYEGVMARKGVQEGLRLLK